MSILPDIIQHIFMQADVNTLFPSALVCKTWNTVLASTWSLRLKQDFHISRPCTCYDYVAVYTMHTSEATYGSQHHIDVETCLYRDIIRDEYTLFKYHYNGGEPSFRLLRYAAILKLTKYLEVLDPTSSSIHVYECAVLFNYDDIVEKYTPSISKQLDMLVLNAEMERESHIKRIKRGVNIPGLSSMLYQIKTAHQFQIGYPLWLSPHLGLLNIFDSFTICGHEYAVQVVEQFRKGEPFSVREKALTMLLTNTHIYKGDIMGFVIKDMPVSYIKSMPCSEYYLLHWARVGSVELFKEALVYHGHSAKYSIDLIYNEIISFHNRDIITALDEYLSMKTDNIESNNMPCYLDEID